MRSYLRHNGSYRSNAILHSVYAANDDPAGGAAWLVSLSSSASDPATVLADIANASWIPIAHRGIIYQRILELKRESADRLTGIARDNAEQELASWQVRWIEYLVRSHQFAPAASAIDALPKQTRDAQSESLVPLELQAAAKLGTLDAKIAAYRSDPGSAPPNEVLRTAARKMFENGDKQEARAAPGVCVRPRD